MKRKFILSIVLILFVLIGCASKEVLIIPTDKYKANYDKMFDAAIAAGVKESFTPTYQDKKLGLITLESKSEQVNINVIFGNVNGGEGFEIKADSPAMNPFTSNLKNKIRDAILQAVNGGAIK